jgi:hypothetical protein
MKNRQFRSNSVIVLGVTERCLNAEASPLLLPHVQNLLLGSA